jgi:hypothetical protein
MNTGKDAPVEVMISRYVKGKMPEGASRDEWREFHLSFTQQKTTAHGLAVQVYQGYSFCPLFSGRRIKQNFLRAWHIALDFDSGDDLSSIRNLSTVDIVKDYASFIYTTASHTEARPKARVVWIFQEDVKQLEFYETLFKALLCKIPYADKAAKDGLRLYYGSPKCTVWGNWKLLDRQTAEGIVSEYNSHHTKSIEVDRPNRIGPEDVSGSYLERKERTILEKLATAPVGKRHTTLLNMSILLGGYVAGGYYFLPDIKDDLIETALHKMNGMATDESIYKTIEDGLGIGLQKPLYIDFAYNAGEHHG